MDDNEKLCAVELKRAPPHARLEAKTAIVVPTELPGLIGPQEAQRNVFMAKHINQNQIL